MPYGPPISRGNPPLPFQSARSSLPVAALRVLSDREKPPSSWQAAPIPQGCDAVVMHENTTTEDGVVTFADSKVKLGQNILRQGAEMRSGQVVLKAGTLLNPPHLGILASVGKTRVPVIPSPGVAIVPTGDELVEPTEYPGPGQIRNSNAVMLRSARHLSRCSPFGLTDCSR